MELKYKSFKEVLISIFVGFSIGLSVIVPGISGSSIAIIMKVYDKLMYSFSNILKKFKSCFLFLLPIIFGIIVGFALGFVLVVTLLKIAPFITICFFIGLMAGTYPILSSEIKGEQITAKRGGLFAVGIILPLILGIASIFSKSGHSITDISPWHYLLFIGMGILVSLTQIIPGLSATVLLMIFGYYSSLMSGVKDIFENPRIILVYISLVIGFVIGILLFSKVINLLLDKKRKQFFFVICGLAIGSMVSAFMGNDCLEIYSAWTKKAMIIDLVFGVILFAAGFVITFALYLFDKKRKNK
jgi:putative membrane protein